jgi:hypothetical protein
MGAKDSAMRLAVLLALVYSPALAVTWTPPAGCEAYVTVQSRSCIVSHLFRCEGDPAGDQWRVDMGQEGEFFYSHIDSEGQWLESYGAAQQLLDPAPADPASITNLLASGLDTADFSVSRDDGTGSRFSGFDRLTGKEVEIDGVMLLQTEIDYTEYDRAGTVVGQVRGNEFIHPDWRTFLGGAGERDLRDGKWLPIDGSPVEFAFPGEDGFLATEPKYDCDALTAELPVWRASYGQ